MGVRVDVLTGTSMGSMIGGAYAAGFTVDELERTVTGVDWDQMLAPHPNRALLSWRKKDDDYKSLPASGIEVTKDGTPKLPESFVPAEELALFLARETVPVDMVRDLSMLPIPFAAPATDLVTGERVIMQKDASVREAMRASMSIPGAFAPAQFHGKLLVDGGLVDNLPVQLARDMGADVVIAVNVGTPLSKREELTNVVGVMAQMVNLLTEQNVRNSLAALEEGDLLITPDLEGFTSADFKRSKEIIAAGEKSARAVAEEIARFIRPKAEWTQWSEARTRYFHHTENEGPLYVTDVIVAERPGAVIPHERILERAQIRTNKTYSRRTLDAAARSLYADGVFESITYRVVPGDNGTYVVELEPRERDTNYSSVRFGGSVETDFDSVSTFNFLFAHAWHINPLGSEWRNELQVGEDQRFLTQFYQPFNLFGLPLFIEPEISWERRLYDIYEGKNAVATWRSATTDMRALLGMEFPRLGYAGVSAGWMSRESSLEVGRDVPPWDEVDASYIGFELFLDTLDNVSFPTKGFRLEANGRFTDKASVLEGNVHLLEVNALVPWSWGPWTAVLEGEYGHTTVSGYYRLGGAGRMAGAPYGRWSGSHLQYGRFAFSRNLSDLLPFPVPVWAGVQGEIGRAWNSGGESAGFGNTDNQWRKSASWFIGVDSPIGAIQLTAGRTFGEGSGIYLLWGYRD
ncbi:patatin-like phospholipase family protein [Sutterella sp.]|uniref:patatin-like phospholipase family protein n=1 Tax=Sutterella sp. TaxID=1981025 RepID=UPI0026DFFE2B|nr:patatin-like phospholipase family protein [Sutterella sp.]MDO5530672.1 patatin-like phospholipase family protein [Sutterella sp.]